MAYAPDGVGDLSLIDSTLAAVEGADDYLEATEACNALAACEVLARLRGNSGYQNAYTEKVDQWVKAHPVKPSDELVARAAAAIDRILADRSELRELWEEAEATEWRASVLELRARVTSRG